MADNTDKIDGIEEVLDSGLASVTVDGVTTSYDQDALLRRRNELRQEDDTLSSSKPRVATMNMATAMGGNTYRSNQ